MVTYDGETCTVGPGVKTHITTTKGDQEIEVWDKVRVRSDENSYASGTIRKLGPWPKVWIKLPANADYTVREWGLVFNWTPEDLPVTKEK